MSPHATQAKSMAKGKNAKNPYARADRFTVEAKKQGYPARSVFKLEEIDRRLRLLRPGMHVLDLGAAPGSWMLYAAQKIGRNGKLLAVDLSEITIPIPENTTFIQGDALSLENEALSLHGPYDLVLSDMAPNTTGNRLGDQTRSFELFMRALAVADKLLKPGGAFLGKIFMGEDFASAKKEVKRLFEEERALKPEGTRTSSYELFLAGLGKKVLVTPGPA
jgi:23S rRNA (uridine2552-2'-O)-methyltransferase